MHEGSMPVRIGPGARPSTTYEGEPPSKRRIVLDQIPEENEPPQEQDQDMEPLPDLSEYTPSHAPEETPPEPEVPALSLPEAPDEPSAPDSQSMQAEPATDLAPSEAENRLNEQPMNPSQLKRTMSCLLTSVIKSVSFPRVYWRFP